MSSSLLKRITRRVDFRLTLLHSAMFTVLGVSILGLAYVMLREAVQAGEREQIEFRLNQFSDQYRRGGVEAVRELCGLPGGPRQTAFFVRVADPENRTVFLRDEDDWGAINPKSLKHPEPEPGVDRAFMKLRVQDGARLEVASLRFANGSVLQVGKSNEDSQGLLARFRNFALLTMLLVIPAGFAGGAIFSFRALRPVRQLSDAVDGILRTGYFDARVPSRHSGDELDDLIELFNSLLARIQSLIRGMREALDNVAHDLRTPMTRLRNVAHTNLEKEGDIYQAREALADCVEESDRVLTMLNTLMDISEAQSGIFQMEREPVPVLTMVQDVMDLYIDVAEDRGVELTGGVPGRLYTIGDAMLLRRALANLVDNAIKYTGRGGKVVLAAWMQREDVVISVRDTGEGISGEDLPRIWDRLYRGDKSRTARGLGLGLSFVKAIVEAHGGEVQTNSRLGVGSTFTMRLPLLKQEPAEAVTSS